MGCAHRDVKPSNILVDWKYNIKVIDFGLGNLYEENEKLRTACGSPCYAAPEIISGHMYDPMNVDIWSCGITLYTMVCGCLPFDEESKTALYDKILSCQYHLSKSLSADVRDLISKMLVKDVKDRATIEEILEHPWLKAYNHSLAESSVFEFGRSVLIQDADICRLAAYKLKADEKMIKQMLEDNEHNKHTTLYYLLVKKKERGDLELEKELEEYAEKEMKKEQREQDKLKKAKKSKLTPPPLDTMNDPAMFIPQMKEHEKPEVVKKRSVSRSIGLSIDADQINQEIDYSNLYKKAKVPTIALGDLHFAETRTKENHPMQVYHQNRKKSTSKSKGRKSRSRDIGLNLYVEFNSGLAER